MSETRYLALDDVVRLHERIMRGLGLQPQGVRDVNALESAIMRARMAGHYEEADLIRQGALMAIGISQAQAFVDGNKRTAFIALDTFLYRNGLDFIGEPIELARQLELVAERIGERDAATDDFEAWLRERTAPLTP